MPPGGFADHFDAVAAGYAEFRPVYPPALFEWLAHTALPLDNSPHTPPLLPVPGSLAWDAGTGSGQAAVGLADYFERVEATDPSAAQLAHARPHPRVNYHRLREGQSGLPAAAADLVTAAQAAHWFDMGAFHAEARRVLKPGGIVAIWCYGLTRVRDDIDALTDWFARSRVGPYWPPGRELVDAGYATISFPWQRIGAPAFTMSARLDRSLFLAYLGTWSSVVRCREAEGVDPVAELEPRLAQLWPDGKAFVVSWPLSVVAGRA